jgi:serine/threonine protein kinase
MQDPLAPDGESLTSLITGAPLPVDQILEVGCKIADALSAAHAKGVVHGDLRPANIVIAAGAQATLLGGGGATAEKAAGSVNYMSPEQARGETLDGRTDLFSLGLVLYEMATGRQAFGGQTTAVVFDAILNRDPAPVQQVNPAVPVDLVHVITRALEKDRRMRYQTAADMVSELSRLRRDTTARTSVAAAATPARPVVRDPLPFPGQYLKPVGLGLLAIGLAAGAYALWMRTSCQPSSSVI